MKTLDKKKVELIDRYVFNCSFSDSQNFLHAFKSLLVFCGVFLNFCTCKNSFRFHLCSKLPRLDSKLFAHSLYLLPRSGLLILPFSRNKPFLVCEDKCYYKVGLDAGVTVICVFPCYVYPRIGIHKTLRAKYPDPQRQSNDI